MSLPRISSVAVIGAGPCGAGLTKALVGEKAFDKIKVFERRAKFGGLWNYTGGKSKATQHVDAPSTDPFKKIEKLRLDNGESFYESPIYKHLDANVPKDLMAYNNYPFAENVPLFPKHNQILEYLENYSKDIEPYVTFNEEVTDVEFNKNKSQWKVVSKSLVGEQAESVDYFDAVAIAVGSYDQPFIPSVPGLKEWKSQYPDSILHAKNYDEPCQFQDDKTILVVGNSASGADIAYQLAQSLNRVIYKSVRSENLMPAGKDERIMDVADLLKFDPVTRSIFFKDGNKLDNVDKVIFATGYLKSIPFVKKEPLITDGAKVHGLYKHLIYYNNPTLAVIGLPRFVLPTRLSETQGCWLARVWSQRITLPSIPEMKQESEKQEGEERKHHDLVFPKDVDYSNELNNEAVAAEGDYGYYAVHWDERQREIRGAIKFIKEGYIKYIEEHGKPAYSLKELEDGKYFEYPVEEEK